MRDSIKKIWKIAWKFLIVIFLFSVVIKVWSWWGEYLGSFEKAFFSTLVGIIIISVIYFFLHKE